MSEFYRNTAAMEVDGKTIEESATESSRSGTSTYELVCQPCDKDGLRIKADGFCIDCEEHLCDTCFKYHTKPAPCRHHVLLSKDAMPKVQKKVTPKAYDDLDLCDKHPVERLKFYCSDHNLIACCLCITIQHRSCKIEYIPDLAQNVKGSEEYRNLCDQINSLKEKFQMSIKVAEEAKRQIDTDYIEIIEEIRKFRKEINEYIDNMMEEILEKAKKHTDDENDKLKQISINSEKFMNEITDYELRFQQLENANKLNRLFTEMMSVKDKVKVIVEQKSSEIIEPRRVEFVRSSALSVALSTHHKLGALLSKGYEFYPKSNDVYLQICDEFTLNSSDDDDDDDDDGDVDIQSIINSGDHHIIRVVALSRTVLALLLNWNHVRLYDLKKHTDLDTYQDSEQMFCIDDILKIPQEKLAVLNLKNRLIVVLSTCDNSLAEEKHILLSEEYNSVVYYKEGLIATVNCYPGRIVILDINGTALKEIVTELLFYPTYAFVGINKEVKKEDEKHSVTQMTFDGEILGIFREDGYPLPTDMQELVDGTFIVCCYEVDILARISRDCTRLKLGGEDWMSIPNLQTFTYNKTYQKLYVACSSTEEGPADTIKVFEVKW